MTGALNNLIYRDSGEALLNSAFRAYVGAKGNATLIVPFIATVAGIKPAMDDWVQVSRLDDYLVMCRRFGLQSRISCFFVGLDQAAAARVVGGERLTTTRAVALPPWQMPEEGEAHVFLSRDTAAMEQAYANGWYGVAIAGRVVEKPVADHSRFANALGYPRCCSERFALHNNWEMNSFYHSIWNNSRQKLSVCNPFTRHTPFAYISHMPCAFDCAATRDYADRVREVVRQDEPKLGQAVAEFTRHPVLCLSERHKYVFTAAYSNGQRISYHDYAPLPPTPRENRLAQLLANGDELCLERNIVRVYRGSRFIGVYEARGDQIGPEIPFIAVWGA